MIVVVIVGLFIGGICLFCWCQKRNVAKRDRAAADLGESGTNKKTQEKPKMEKKQQNEEPTKKAKSVDNKPKTEEKIAIEEEKNRVEPSKNKETPTQHTIEASEEVGPTKVSFNDKNSLEGTVFSFLNSF